ncbi:MAG: CinA family protein [Spirochaetaceae bacterium]
MPVFLLPRESRSLGHLGRRGYYTFSRSGTGGEGEWDVEREGAIRIAPDDSLEAAVISAAAEEGVTLTSAESCTGGALAAALTEVPGSSSVFLGGVISYSYEMKELLLGVARETLDRYGAVSPECAEQMCSGTEKRLGGTVQIAITGIAGPGGGTSAKPVGLVYMAMGSGGRVEKYEFRYSGGRKEIRGRSVEAALLLLHGRIRGTEDFPLEVIDGKRLTAG